MINIERLDWDTSFFGVEAGRVILHKEDDTKELVSKLQEFDFVTIVNVNNDPKKNFEIGISSTAFLTDIKLVFQMNLNENFNSLRKDFTKTDVNSSHLKDIRDIASHSFYASRYYNDPVIDNSLAAKMYDKWVDKAHDDVDSEIIVSIDNHDKVQGFAILSICGKTASIELIAVKEDYRKKSIGTKLIEKIMELGFVCGVETILVTTQVDNISAINFYVKNGFKLKEKNSIYHYWNERYMKYQEFYL
ncbi:GNAT family N-acetyltransferase [Enterococcus viikkiensis]|uniref:GNAT family N-acetyltransferase n=1 Tax=Enterococcus viikkiensis TaxID=930854 RepID=A0ABU3FMK9_9ENTE|nr:GNAT family N-acetyltransferase [Enterococcus viikkiensis]MDT2827207.1 GNAT family N-acetyltransferase [Enterococcus viikkiensis]MDU6522454.1 GNAT family N-acetyltransferase [Enterococcus sp.]